MLSPATLVQLLSRPWLMEPTQAPQWAHIAEQVIFQGGAWANLAPYADVYSDKAMGGPVYKVNDSGAIDPAGSVLVMNIQGPVMKADYCGAMGMETMQNVIRQANADSGVEAILLRIDSPGGTVDGTHNLARTIKASGKPVVAHVDGMMASAAYWIGSSAAEVIADDANGGHNAVIGSIGTMAQYVDGAKSLEQRGLSVHTVYATKSKRKNEHARQVFGGRYERLVAELDALNDGFVASVQANRAGKLKPRLEDVFEGDVYNALDAMRFGLIDKIGTFGYAVKRAIQISKTLKK